MPYLKTLVKPGTCPICTKHRPAHEQITCAKCWWHVLNGKDRQELAAIHRRAGNKSDEACAPKCAKIVKRLHSDKGTIFEQQLQQTPIPPTPIHQVTALGHVKIDVITFPDMARAEAGL